MLENREIINYNTEAEWLALRKVDYTSTVTSGILGFSPYCTAFEIYHAKKSGLHVPFEPNERTEKGKRLEAAIAEEVGLEMGCEVKPMKFYVRIPGTSIGSSFDYQINHKDHGWIPLEIKCVDHFIYKKAWLYDELPDHIELQAQHQMHTANASHAIVAAATSIYDVHIYKRARDIEIGKSIELSVRNMEDRIANRNPPVPDFSRDSDVINLLFPFAEGELDATGDIELEGLASKHKRLKAESSEIDKQIDALKTEIHFKLEGKAKAFTQGFVIDCAWTKDSAPTLITPEMVGSSYGGRKGYRKLLIKDLRK